MHSNAFIVKPLNLYPTVVIYKHENEFRTVQLQVPDLLTLCWSDASRDEITEFN